MLDRHAQTGTRCRKTNKNHSYSTSTANQIAIPTHCNTHLPQIMDSDNNNNRQNRDKISCKSDTRESTLRYHWGAKMKS